MPRLTRCTEPRCDSIATAPPKAALPGPVEPRCKDCWEARLQAGAGSIYPVDGDA